MDCSACLSCGMVVLLIIAGCRLFHSLMVLGRRMICIPLCGHMAGCSVEYSRWLTQCDVVGGWNVCLYVDI